MKKEILENMKQIKELKAENKKLNEQIKDDGIQLANTLLSSLYARLRIYTAILKELSTGMNIQTSKSYTLKYRGVSSVHITFDYSHEKWNLLFDNRNIDLSKGINSSIYYTEFCVDNPVILELDFDEICNKIEDFIINVQNDKINKLINENNKKRLSLESFKTFVDNNLMTTLNKLFKLKNDFKDTGELDLIEPIIEEIDKIENYIAEDLD